MLNQPDFGGPPPWPFLPPRADRDTEQGYGRPTEPIRPSRDPKGTEQAKGDDRMLHALHLYDRRADLRTSIGQNQGCPAACLAKPCIPLAVHVGSMVLICALVLGWVLYIVTMQRELHSLRKQIEG